jgi:hypothetical protein
MICPEMVYIDKNYCGLFKLMVWNVTCECTISVFGICDMERNR